ncbi:MAG: hypothetical protein ABFS28_08775, partial [Bacteroidota bacterium]
MIKYPLLGLLAFVLINNAFSQNANTTREGLKVNFEYAPLWWQTAIGLPDDHLKTVIGKEGQMYYDFVRVLAKKDKHGPFRGFRTEISLQIPDTCQWKDQKLASPKIPIIETYFESGNMQIQQSGFTVAPAFINKPGNKDKQYLGIKAQRDYNANDSIIGAPRNDISIVRYLNTGKETISFSPVILVNTAYKYDLDLDGFSVYIGEHLQLRSTQKIVDSEVESKTLRVFDDDVKSSFVTLTLNEIKLDAGEEYSFAYGLNVGQNPIVIPNDVEQAVMLKHRSNKYWADLNLPYNKIVVPDENIQNLLKSSIRNIYQAREEDNGLLSFQVGPTVYRGLWVVDGA